MIFPVVDVQFIESAYIAGESKQSISARALNGRALGPSTVDEIVGVPGGIFVLHKARWTFCAWANVKSASLAEAPAEILSYLAARRRVVEPERLVAPPAPVADAAPARGRRRAGAGGGIPALQVAEPTTSVPAPDDAADLLGGPPAPPRRDAMGVLIAEQPQSGPKITCSACGGAFVQGSNHACQKV